MDEVKAQIQTLTAFMLDRFEKIDERFEQIDQRFEKIDRQFKQIDKRFIELRTELKEDISNVGASLRSDIANVESGLRDEIRALELKNNVRFDELAAGQAKLEASQADFKAQLTRLEERLFYAEGTRETQADVLYHEHKDDTKRLLHRIRNHEQRLKRLEQRAV